MDEAKRLEFYTQQLKIRNMVNMVYDIQKLRIAAGNRLAANMRASQEAEEISESMSSVVNDSSVSNTDDQEAEKKLLTLAMEEYKRLHNLKEEKNARSVDKLIASISNELQVIRSRIDYDLTDTYARLVDTEVHQLKSIKPVVESHPIWDAFLADVKGCGQLMGGVCIAYLDPYKARHVSSFWKFAGLDVVVDENGAHGRRRGDTEMRPYVDRNGEPKEKRSLTYSPFLKTKLIGVLSTGFLKARGSHYGQIYYNYKHRITHRNDPSLTPKHIHMMASRYAVKMFLADLWVKWRELEGLPITKPYAEEFLHREPHGSPNLGPVSDGTFGPTEQFEQQLSFMDLSD